MKRQPPSQHETRIELAENLELAVVVDDQRLCARISPTTARLLAGALLDLALESSRRAQRVGQRGSYGDGDRQSLGVSPGV